MGYANRWTTVRVEVDGGVAWVELNRPEKRNAMSPTLNAEMVEVLLELDGDDDCGVLVLTGAGESWSAGMDLKEYFREVDGGPEHVQRRVRRDAAYWQWRLLRTYAKPTIAMVNGWCFGGAFTPLVACDLAIAADEATFGLSEINWGIPPGSVVSKALADTVGSRAGLLYVMTGRTFGGRQAAEMGLVNDSVPARAAPGRGRVAGAGAAREEPGRAAGGEARLQALRSDELGSGGGLPLREARAVPVPRHRAGPRAGPRAVPRREEDQARPPDLRTADRVLTNASVKRETVAAVLDRLGVETSRPDLVGLHAVYAAWCGAVPFDNVLKMIYLAEGRTGPLPGSTAESFFEAWLACGVGGTCWAGNGALHDLLEGARIRG